MKGIAIYSGGLDSTVLLYMLRDWGHEVKALSIQYGQRHSKELWAARSICADLGVEHHFLDLSNLRPLLGGSSQTDSTIPVPHGHYAEESMKATVVPNRNMIMLAAAAAWAISSKFDYVTYGAHGGDHAIYPDCRPEFVGAMDQAIQLADWHKVVLKLPFKGMPKSEIVYLGKGLKVPFERTWSCYEGGAIHCGKCGTCVERREAFILAKVEDPTEYATVGDDGLQGLK